jgi:protoporphyrin/coproporphyrin ferrochelatase
MVHGSADALDDEAIASYLARMMRGREPSAEQIADLRRRYEVVGGTGTLMQRGLRQVERLAEVLGPGYAVALGAKHSSPSIGEAVADVVAQGAKRVVGVALAPHESRLTTSQYDEAGASAAAGQGVAWVMVRSWHTAPALIELWAERVTAAMAGAREPVRVLFTAHSLPAIPGDPYPAQVTGTAKAVASAAGLRAGSWEVVYQSVPPSADPGAWLGPNLDDSFRSDERAVVVPIGFVSDHLEVRYDIDVQARERAQAVGAILVRAEMPNDEPRLARAIAAQITAA